MLVFLHKSRKTPSTHDCIQTSTNAN